MKVFAAAPDLHFGSQVRRPVFVPLLTSVVVTVAKPGNDCNIFFTYGFYRKFVLSFNRPARLLPEAARSQMEQ